MKTNRIPSTATIAVAILCVCTQLALAQATRTWVSGVGDDVNPCSRTAPCKTFAGAISKTAAGGEINVIDNGPFGAVTVTKSITISGDGGFAGVLASGTNGVIVNGAGVIVTLRNLDINGAATGLNGINFLNGAALHVENCVIYGFNTSSAGNGNGIKFTPSGNAQLFVKDTTIRNNGSGTTIGGGILVFPSAAPPTASAACKLVNVRLEKNSRGLRVERGGVVDATDCVAAMNANAGFQTAGSAGGAAISLESCSATGCAIGIQADGAGKLINISNCTVFSNTTGLEVLNTANIVSFGNNRNRNNGTDGAPTLTVPQQ